VSEPYREGHEYVVCEDCKSEILIDRETRERLFEDDEDETAWIGFTCDWEPCSSEQSALVVNPHREAQP
jgi:hypothetical protein